MKTSVLAQLGALKGAPASALKARWRELFDTEPPAYKRNILGLNAARVFNLEVKRKRPKASDVLAARPGIS
jgi:hypothetical protein